MEQLLLGLRAAAEPTRLRLLSLCAQGELTVSELTDILGQSQPRVSRHLKLLCEAGLLDRFREANWVFYRIARGAGAGDRARRIVELVPAHDPVVALDRERLAQVKRQRVSAAEAYFRTNAAHWDRIRSLHIDDREVEATLVRLLADEPIDDFLDIGTGTGRVLEVMAPKVERAVGLDLSREMLAVARVNLERAGADNCSIRQGDMYQLPLPGASFDAVVIHQVLHYAEEPARAVAEAARVLRPGGRLVVADFAPHELEFLRQEHAHRRLGFGEDEIIGWCREAGLEPAPPIALPGDQLTVMLWLARRPAAPAERAHALGVEGVVLMLTAALLGADPLEAAGARRPSVSFEFFPPKTAEMEERLWQTVKRFEPLSPRFVSVTYGAGGTTRERTHATVRRIRQETALEPAAHLTCIGASRGEIDDIARLYWESGIRHLVALRGDPPAGEGCYRPHAQGYPYAADLVAGLLRIAPFEVSVAAYPETHPEAESHAADLDNLKRKVDAGARRAITQLFFDAEHYLRFRDRARAAGIAVPIVPGILPVTNFAQVQKFAAGCGASLPSWMPRLFDGLDDDPDTRRLVAASIAAEQCRRLQAEGVEEFHFYTLNRADLIVAICHMIGVRAEHAHAAR